MSRLPRVLRLGVPILIVLVLAVLGAVAAVFWRDTRPPASAAPLAAAVPTFRPVVP